MKQVLLPIVTGLLGLAVGGQVADRPPSTPAPAPMPAPSPAPSPKTPDGPHVVKSPRVEVLGADGGVVLVLTSENGVPVALVSDNGIARRIDLVKVARLVK